MNNTCSVCQSNLFLSSYTYQWIWLIIWFATQVHDGCH